MLTEETCYACHFSLMLMLSHLLALSISASRTPLRPFFPPAGGPSYFLQSSRQHPQQRQRRNDVRASVAEVDPADEEKFDTVASAITARRKPRVLSGVQPTGLLHLGNYLGAIKQWVANQDRYDNYFCVVDSHAITSQHDPKELTKSTYRTAAMYLACGIDPVRSNVFVQSHVPAHSELAWLLNCATPMGWLERMIQFKEKSSSRSADSISVGLFDYPVLMAADILLYETALVPVGEDQRQHLELTRDIAARFNNIYCKNKKRGVFVEPQSLIVRSKARVMSLQDGTSKMSKSAENDATRINMLDSPDEIRRKIKRCKTDSIRELGYADDRPEANNLLGIYEAMTGKSREEVAIEAATWGGWGEFKPILADAIIDHLAPVQTRYKEIVADKEYLTGVLAEGAEAANIIAGRTLTNAKRAMGFTLPGDLPKGL